MPTPKAAPPPPETGPGSDEDFIFESSAGTIVIPSLATCKKPKPYLLSKAKAAENNDAVLILIVQAALGKNVEKVEKILGQLEDDELGKFFDGWRDHSGMSTGE